MVSMTRTPSPRAARRGDGERRATLWAWIASGRKRRITSRRRHASLPLYQVRGEVVRGSGVDEPKISTSAAYGLRAAEVIPLGVDLQGHHPAAASRSASLRTERAMRM